MISINYVVDRIKAKVLIAELDHKAAELKEKVAENELRVAQIEIQIAESRMKSIIDRREMIYSMLARGDDPSTVQSVTDSIYRKWDEDLEVPPPP